MEVEVLEVCVLKQLVFVCVGIGVVKAVLPLRVESQFVGAEIALAEHRGDAHREKSVFAQRERDRNRNADLRRRQFETALFVVIENKRACEKAVIFPFCPVNLVLHTARKSGVRHRYAAPLVAVVGHKAHIAAKNSGKAGIEVEWGIAELGKVNVLRHRGKNRQKQRERKVETQA